eukprot:Hpha_TRINITY_DN888_c0_g1::TRINITY_DN888_c0_g1_i1::g.195018::m.195018
MGQGCCCCRKRAQDNVLEEKREELLNAAEQEMIGDHTEVNADQFEAPAEPVGVSGGTAAFYSLRYKKPPFRKTERWYIGKDLAHAMDELSFYETAATLRRDHPGVKWSILDWTFEYGGVCTIDCSVGGGRTEPRKQLLIRNLFDEARNLRLIDIKIGAVTAVAGWQGKSRSAAMRNRAVDSATNSQVEGYRAEGFDGAPKTLDSLLSATTRDLLHGIGTGIGQLAKGSFAAKAKFEVGGKKARRIALQRFTAYEFLGFFAYAEPENPDKHRFNSLEVNAMGMRGCLKSLLGLLSAASAVPVPQQWIGSSVALAFDSAARPERPPGGFQAGQEETGAKVHIFDWGRSELMSKEIFKSLPKNTRKERAQHWFAWVAGILRLSFEVARAYRRLYCPRVRWKRLRVRIWSVSQDIGITDVTKGTDIGEVLLDLAPMAPTDHVLRPVDRSLMSGAVDAVKHAHIKTLSVATKAGRVMFDALQGKISLEQQKMKVRIEVRKQSFDRDSGSVFDEQWVIRVIRAESLPKTETIEWCNPVATVTLIDQEGFQASYNTGFQFNTKDPQWDTSFVFGAVKEEARSNKALVPEGLLEFAPRDPGRESGGTIMDWELPSDIDSTPERIQDALRAFQNAFFQKPKGAEIDDIDDIASMSSLDGAAAQELRDGVLMMADNAVDDQRVRQLEAAERTLQEQEKVLQKTIQKAAEADQRASELELDYDWLRQQWKNTHGELPTHRPGSPRHLGTPAVGSVAVDGDGVRREVSAFELHRERGGQAADRDSPNPVDPRGDQAIDRCFGPSDGAMSEEPCPTFDRLGAREGHTDPHKTATSDTAQLEGLLRREQELQKRWEALVARCVHQAPLQPYTQTPPRRSGSMGSPSPGWGSPPDSSWQRPHVPSRHIGTPAPPLPMSTGSRNAFPPRAAAPHAATPSVVNFGGVWSVI